MRQRGPGWGLNGGIAVNASLAVRGSCCNQSVLTAGARADCKLKLRSRSHDFFWRSWEVTAFGYRLVQRWGHVIPCICSQTVRSNAMALVLFLSMICLKLTPRCPNRTYDVGCGCYALDAPRTQNCQFAALGSVAILQASSSTPLDGFLLRPFSTVLRLQWVDWA